MFQWMHKLTVSCCTTMVSRRSDCPAVKRSTNGQPPEDRQVVVTGRLTVVRLSQCLVNQSCHQCDRRIQRQSVWAALSVRCGSCLLSQSQVVPPPPPPPTPHTHCLTHKTATLTRTDSPATVSDDHPGSKRH